MRTTLRVPDDLHRRAKEFAARTGSTLQAVLTEALTQRLDGVPETLEQRLRAAYAEDLPDAGPGAGDGPRWRWPVYRDDPIGKVLADIFAEEVPK